MEIRNFCIIAHIDHGKSTLADRMLELTNTVDKREMKSQLLDSMDLEREKGITIKLTPVQMQYKDHELNLIDTPGHVDFSYEVSRSLQAVEGAILVVDASQGIQAQTLANVYLAIEQNLTIIPVINKIDLPAANVPKVSAEIINLLGCNEADIIKVSAKTGVGVPDVLDAVVEKVPAPRKNDGSEGTRALIFDSYFDDYRGVILYVRVFDGKLPKNGNIRMMAAESNGIALEVGTLKPKMSPRDSLNEGEIGYIVTNLKTTREAKVGDTVTLAKTPAKTALPGYKNIHPFVYAGFFPVSNDQYKDLKEAIEKLSLSDSALQYEPENSPVLGFGLRIGFLGLLHLDIIRERLEREFDLDLVITNPSTDYHVTLTTGEELDIKSASDLPDVTKIAEIREPWIKGEIIIPKEYVGAIIDLVIAKRGRQRNLSYMDDRAVVDFEAPMANLLTDFYDQLKSSTSGYGSFNYELADYRAEDLVRIDFYVAGERIDALSVMAHRSEADAIGRDVTKKLKEAIPRQNFEVALQAAIGARFIARETLGAFRKDVTGYLYGGDVSRKKKLLAKQKKGKARMKRFGKVDIPSEAFTIMLKRD
ncbi:MAG: translation elongation factor 4 [Candidatus Saccharimonadales bacterium]